MRIGVYACALVMLQSVACLADDTARHPAVVELYTSQGCSSCPPADALLAELARQEGVIALALHVDYWDYIGWPDTFGQPVFAKRQRAYAIAAGEKMVYTPQIIVNGKTALIGDDVAGVSAALHPVGDAKGPVLELVRKGDRLMIRADSTGPLADGTFVQLVRYLPHAAVTIERGENAGRTIDYNNIVTSWQHIGEWDGQGPLNMSVVLDGEGPAVVLLQNPGPGAIISAALSE